eukprot:gene5941-8189_t
MSIEVASFDPNLSINNNSSNNMINNTGFAVNSILENSSSVDMSVRLNLIADTKALAIKLRILCDDQQKLSKIKGSDELINKLDEILLEIEEQTDKLSATINSRAVHDNLLSLKSTLNEVNDYFHELNKTKSMFLAKGHLKRRMQLLYQTLRSKCTQLMTSISLELLTGKQSTAPSTLPKASNLDIFYTGIAYYYGICGKPKNYAWAFEKFLNCAELDYGEAMVMVGKSYINGHGVDIDSKLGLEWLERAANMSSCHTAKNEIAMLIINNLKAINPNIIIECFDVSNGITSHYNTANRMSLNSNHQIPLMIRSLANEYEEKDDDNDDNTRGYSVNDEDDEINPEHDVQFAIKLLLEASEAGNIDAKVNLGKIYEEIGDNEQAAKWYSLASNSGSSKATYCLGSLFLHGKEMVANRYKAYSLLMIATKNGEECAYNDLGLCYEAGIGVDCNISAALDCYKKGAELGHNLAMYNFGYLLIKTAIDTLEHLKKLKPHYRASKFGLNISGNLQDEKRSNKVNSNNNKNQLILLSEETLHDINLYEEMEQNNNANLTEGIKWLRAASERRVADAAFQLGRLYEQALGLPEDITAALNNYLYASTLGHIKAGFYAANILYANSMNENNNKSYEDLEQACNLYRVAANAGITDAMNSLAILLEDGRATVDREPDLYSAAMWYYEACVSNHEKSFLNLALLLATSPIKSFQTLSGDVIDIKTAKEFLEDHFSVEMQSFGPHSTSISNIIQALDDIAKSELDDSYQEHDQTNEMKLSSSINQNNSYVRPPRYNNNKVVSSSFATTSSMNESMALLAMPKSSRDNYRYAESDNPTFESRSSSRRNSHNISNSQSLADKESSSLVLRNNTENESKRTSQSSIDLHKVRSLWMTSPYKNNLLNNSINQSVASYSSNERAKVEKAKHSSSHPINSDSPMLPKHVNFNVENNNNNSSNIKRQGELYSTNGPIPPPNYVPKAVLAAAPSADTNKPIPHSLKSVSQSKDNNKYMDIELDEKVIAPIPFKPPLQNSKANSLSNPDNIESSLPASSRQKAGEHSEGILYKNGNGNQIKANRSNSSSSINNAKDSKQTKIENNKAGALTKLGAMSRFFSRGPNKNSNESSAAIGDNSLPHNTNNDSLVNRQSSTGSFDNNIQAVSSDGDINRITTMSRTATDD